MAPALTEPISPTEKITSSAVSATTTPSTRSSRKLDPIAIKTNSTILKQQSPQLREKRNCKGSSSLTVVQTPTSSIRLTRSRDTQQQRTSATNSPTINIQSSKDPVTPRKSARGSGVLGTAKHVNSKIAVSNNEQMGLSTAPLDNNNLIGAKATGVETSVDTVQEATSKVEDTSTAQLLADLTNEALTAEICLRNQLKDVNLVKASEDSSTALQRAEDIVVIKAALEADGYTAHMEAQCNESEIKSTPLQQDSHKEDKEPQQTKSETNLVDVPKKEEGNPLDAQLEQQKENNVVTEQKTSEDKAETEEGVSTDVDMETVSTQESPIGSPDYIDTETKKDTKDTSKLEIISVEELPPVNTDSTMTASEVEDNLEERLSQLDGTAIDSPPPSHELDRDATIKADQNVDSTATTTPPRTPTHQHSLAQDMHQIQQQLQNTPPTPVSQQVQAHHVQQQQSNCFTPQSTTSSVNTLGSGNIPPSFIKESEGGELEDQDIEEVFKVLKGFEGGTASDLNVCDLNVLFNEVYMKMNESEINGNGAGGSNAGAGSSSTIIQSHAITPNPSIQLVKPTELEEGQLEIEKRQQQMQRKIDFLTRRLRKLQSRYMCKHTSEEIAGLFEWGSRQSGKGITNNINTLANSATPDPSRYFLKIISARPPTSDWKDEQEATVPATQITTLLRKIEAVANAQQHCITPAASLVQLPSTTKKTKKALLLEAQAAAASSSASMGAGASTSTLGEGRAEDVIVSTLDENVTDELTQVAGLLQSEMCEVQRAIDSDATESSSGGESADEMVTYNNQQQQTLPITKRAAWRYSRDRAAIASRWSWLLSQISDLEIKIRQHSELHQEIVRSKGLVTSQSENGVRVDGETEESGSCRTRGYVSTQFRKRKLIQTTNIHTISKKAARPSTIKCGCQWPLHPCALCTGRSDPTAPRDLPDTMMMSDRIALLDSGYHPVLSFKENVNNALHFEAIAKQPDWQYRVMRCQAKNIAKSVWKAEREAVAAAGSSKKHNSDTPPTKRRYIKKKDREMGNGTGPNLTSLTRSDVPSSITTTDAAAASGVSGSSLTEAENGTANLSTTSTTPLVANKVMGKSAKKPQCPTAVSDGLLKDLARPSPLVVTSSSTNASIPNATTMTLLHQTSDRLRINYDQYNLNQTHSSSISNISSKSNKHRKHSSASTAGTTHYHHSHHNNIHLYNGDSNYLLSHDGSTGIGGVVDGIAARSRTSSPTHGNSYHNKSERLFDRKNRISYDIDNIVIPYSVAAATRVEILPYKEIPTPKWRLLTNIDGEETNTDFSESEDNIKTSSNGFLSDSNKSQILVKNAPVSRENLEENNIKQDCRDVKEDSNKSISSKNAVKYSYTDTTMEINDENGKNKVNEIKAVVNEKYHDDANIKEPNPKKPKVEANVIDIPTSNQVVSETEVNSAISDSLNEDISDDAMILRHERALTEERRKFQTYLKFPWSTRSRANRRIDSRAESSGANTPDPSSPAPHTPSVGGGDQESIPSPSTPINTLDTISELGDNSTSFLGVGFLGNQSSKQRQERRRTTSTKRDRELERRSSTPDSREHIPPYEAMKFPLNDSQFEELMSAMPSEHSEESKRFDDCYLPGGSTKQTRNSVNTGGNTSKRSSRSSTVCGDRRVKGSAKNTSTDDALENSTDIVYDEEYDDYPKHHLAPNDDHLTADNCDDPGSCIDDFNDMYDNHYDDAYTRRPPRLRNVDSDGDSTETEPFQDDDPNDPEWKGEVEDRSRKKL